MILRGRPNYMDIASSKFMFNNCISLTSLYLYKIKFYENENFNNMFSNCISLETLTFNDFNNINKPINMSYMFYNCTKLFSLAFPSKNMELPYDMSHSFAYCSSLKKLELEFYNYSKSSDINIHTMSNAFRNCTSLTSIDLKFEFIYEDMSYLFMGCTSLQFIKTSFDKFFYTKYLNGMFIDCYSLYSVEFGNLLLKNNTLKFNKNGHFLSLTDISYMLSGTSVESVYLSNLNTENITNYEGLFYDCKYLWKVDLSSFTHNNLPDSNLSIFKGTYLYTPYLYINKEFLSKIQVPPNFEIRVSENNRYF